MLSKRRWGRAREAYLSYATIVVGIPFKLVVSPFLLHPDNRGHHLITQILIIKFEWVIVVEDLSGEKWAIVDLPHQWVATIWGLVWLSECPSHFELVVRICYMTSWGLHKDDWRQYCWPPWLCSGCGEKRRQKGRIEFASIWLWIQFDYTCFLLPNKFCLLLDCGELK